MKNRDQPESAEDQLPQELVEQMKREHAPPFRVSDDFDQRVIAGARQILMEGQPSVRRSPTRKRWAAAVTVVSSVALLAFVALRIPQDGGVQRQQADATASAAGADVINDDVDGDGQVDILDALALARVLKSGGPVPVGQDRDQDGALTQNDVDLLARSVVLL